MTRPRTFSRTDRGGTTSDGDERARADEDVARALAVPTRAGIWRRLRGSSEPRSAREVAEDFGIHPNVARNHLDVLADAGLLVTGQRRQPAGGRPAKVYVAREQAEGDAEADVPTGAQLAVATVVQLIAGLAEHEPRLELLAEQQGRRLVDVVGGRADAREFEAAVVVAVEAVDDLHDEHVHVGGLEVALRIVGEVDGRVGDALARGLLRGAIAAAGAPALVSSRSGRVRAELDVGGLGDHPSSVAEVDARGLTYESGVVATVRAMVELRPGDHLEVLTDLEGAPAAFARWAWLR